MKRQNQKGMILAIDMGNTNIVIGCVDDEKIILRNGSARIIQRRN